MASGNGSTLPTAYAFFCFVSLVSHSLAVCPSQCPCCVPCSGALPCPCLHVSNVSMFHHSSPTCWLAPWKAKPRKSKPAAPGGRMIARRVSHHMGSQSPLVSFPPGYCPRTKVSSRYAPMARLLGLIFSCIIHILTIPLRILILRASPLLLVFLSP